MLLNTSGTDNCAIGTDALLDNDSGGFNNAVGSFALFNNIDGFANNAFGESALFWNIHANHNTAIGQFALGNNDSSGNGSANENTAVGSEALAVNINGSENTAVGSFALGNNQASGLTAIGADALSGNTDGIRNTAAGTAALLQNEHADDNTAVGWDALLNNDSSRNGTANGNTAVGSEALEANINGSDNTAVGFEAANFATNGGNTVVGAFAGGTSNGISIGHNNTVVGAFSGEHMGIGNSNLYLGVGVDPGVAEQNFTRINDSNAQAAGSNSRVFLGSIDNATNVGPAVDAANLLINTVTGQLGTTVTSSARFKKDIKPMDKASESILALRPVTFHYKEDKASRLCFGLIAEDVAKVDPALVELDEGGKPNSVRYQEIPIRLLNEFLKEHKKVEEQGAIIARQQKQIEALTAGLQKVSAQLELSKAAPQTVLNDQ